MRRVARGQDTSDGKRAKNRGQNGCLLLEMSLVYRIIPTGPMQSAPLHRLVALLTLHEARSPVQGQQQRDTSQRAKAPPSSGALLRPESRSPYYKAGRYASQVGYAQICLLH